MSVPQATAAPRKKRERIAPNLWRNLKTGRYEDIRNYPGEGQKLVTLKARTLTEAKAEQRALAVKLDNGQAVAPTRVKLSEVWQDFESMYESLVLSGERSERSLDSYRRRYRVHIEPQLASMPIQSVRAEHLSRLLGKLRRAGLAPETVKGVDVVLQTIFGHAITRGIISDSPRSRLSKMERPSGGNRTEARLLSHADCAALVGHATPTWRPMIVTAIGTGLRQSELLGLRWQDVDFEAGLVRVRFQLSRGTGTNPPKLVRLKSGAAERDVRLLPELATALKAHKLASRFSTDADFLFCTAEGKPLSQRNSSRALTNAGDHAGLNPRPPARLLARLPPFLNPSLDRGGL